MTNHKDQKPNSRLVGCDTEVAQAIEALIICFEPVSYTHLTLPTILPV